MNMKTSFPVSTVSLTGTNESRPFKTSKKQEKAGLITMDTYGKSWQSV